MSNENDIKLLQAVRLIRDDYFEVQVELDWLMDNPSTAPTLVAPLADEADFRVLAGIGSKDDSIWCDVAGARRRWIRLLAKLDVHSSIDLGEVQKLHDVIDVAREGLCSLAGLEYKPHCNL